MKRKPWILAVAMSAMGVGALVGGQAAVRAPDQPASLASAARVATSALEAVPGFRMVESSLDEAQFEREETARQNLIRQCMAARGFSYTPVTPQHVDSASTVPAESGVDPNISWVMSLDAKTRAAHYRALYGTDNPFEPTASATPEGCATQAYARIPGVFALSSTLSAELEDLRRAMANDPRVVAADARWRDCMAAQGFAVSSREEMLRGVDSSPAGDRSALAADRTHCAAGLDEVRNTVRIAYENAFAAAHAVELRAHQERLAADEALVLANQDAR